jgi:hypothetical protein
MLSEAGAGEGGRETPRPLRPNRWTRHERGLCRHSGSQAEARDQQAACWPPRPRGREGLRVDCRLAGCPNDLAVQAGPHLLHMQHNEAEVLCGLPCSVGRRLAGGGWVCGWLVLWVGGSAPGEEQWGTGERPSLGLACRNAASSSGMRGSPGCGHTNCERPAWGHAKWPPLSGCSAAHGEAFMATSHSPRHTASCAAPAPACPSPTQACKSWGPRTCI